jgi:hypothetical protein
MNPREEFRALLADVRRYDNGHDWAVRCALAHITQADPAPELAEIAELARQCREQLGVAKIVPMPVRLFPNEEEMVVFDGERERIRQAYRAGGLEAASQALRSSVWRDFIMSYPQWYREGRQLGSRCELVAAHVGSP